MPIGVGTAAVIGAVGSVAGGVLGAVGASSAAKTQAEAADKATEAQLQMYEATTKALQPYNDVGQGAIYSLASLYGLPGKDGTVAPPDYSGFTNSPDYAFAMSEGIKALDASAAAKGNLLSGGQLKAIEEYGSGLASQNYGNYFNKLLQLSTLGENAGAQTGAAAVTTGQGLANSQLAAGEAQASGTVGVFNNLSKGLSGAFDNLATPGAYSGTTAIGGVPGMPWSANQDWQY